MRVRDRYGRVLMRDRCGRWVAPGPKGQVRDCYGRPVPGLWSGVPFAGEAAGFMVPDAVGSPDAVWPLATKPRWHKRSFASGRPSSGANKGVRRHAGIDLKAPEGTDVYAPEDGKIVRIQGFLGSTKAIIMRADSGIAIVLGEVDPATIKVARGQRVFRGQLVGHVGHYDMLHFETRTGSFTTYRKGTGPQNPGSAWWTGHAPPSTLLDPRDYIARAAEHQERPWEPPPPDPYEPPDEPDIDPYEPPDEPDVEPPPPPVDPDSASEEEPWWKDLLPDNWLANRVPEEPIGVPAPPHLLPPDEPDVGTPTPPHLLPQLGGLPPWLPPAVVLALLFWAMGGGRR